MRKVLTSFNKFYYPEIESNFIKIYDLDGVTLREFIDHNGFKSIRYRDEYVGGNWVNAGGLAAPDTVDVSIGGINTRMLSFDGNNIEERISNNFEIPHDIALDEVNNEAEVIEWHVHFMASTNKSGTIKWFLDYCYIPANGTPISQTSLVCYQVILANEQHVHHLAGAELPVPSSGVNIGDIITFNLRRTPTDVKDTYPDDVLLIKTALHVPINDFGSRQRYVK